jgi:hypothetical protein
MRLIRGLLALMLLWAPIFGAPVNADNGLDATAPALFKVFQESIIGIVMGDSKTVVKFASAHYLKGIADQNREDLNKYQDKPAVQKRFEDLTGVAFKDLIALPDHELAIVVIDKLVPTTRTAKDKKRIVTSMRHAVLVRQIIQNGKRILQVKYPDGGREKAVFVQEDDSWRLDEVD